MRTVFAVQPYNVGRKNGKSLVIVIPAAVVRKYDITPETIFRMTVDENLCTITLQSLPPDQGPKDVQETETVVAETPGNR